MSLDQARNIVKHQTRTRDAFLGGKLNVLQSANGFRAGLDGVLLGAAVTAWSGELLDLGTGAGVAGLVALAHNEGLSAVLVDNNPEMVELALANISGNGFTERVRAVSGDVTGDGASRQAVGLKLDHFGAVIANPPYFDVAAGTAPLDPGRADARHMGKESLDLWIRTAAGCAAPGAEIIFIHRIEALGPLLAGFTRRFGAVTVLPLAPRRPENVTRVLVRGIKGSRAPLAMVATRFLHGPEKNGFSPEFDAIFKGKARLIW